MEIAAICRAHALLRVLVHATAHFYPASFPDLLRAGAAHANTSSCAPPYHLTRRGDALMLQRSLNEMLLYLQRQWNSMSRNEKCRCRSAQRNAINLGAVAATTLDQSMPHQQPSKKYFLMQNHRHRRLALGSTPNAAVDQHDACCEHGGTALPLWQITPWPTRSTPSLAALPYAASSAQPHCAQLA